MLPDEKINLVKELIFKTKNLIGHLTNLTDLLELVVKGKDWQSNEMLMVAVEEIRLAIKLTGELDKDFNKVEEFLIDFLSHKNGI